MKLTGAVDTESGAYADGVDRRDKPTRLVSFGSEEK